MKRVVIITVIFSLLLLLPGCKKVIDKITGKDYGKYTSITVRITINYKGLNSKGIRKFSVDDVAQVNEYFSIAGTPTMNSTCDDSILDKTHVLELTITKTTMEVLQQYFDWDYTKWKWNSTNVKMLCTKYKGEIVSYQYESGKDDPGTPLITGLDDLVGWTTESNCTKAGRMHNCNIGATLTFGSPYTTQNNAAKSTAFVSQRKIVTDFGQENY